MEQSPYWEANRFAACQEIPRFSRNPNAHYRTHKRPPPVSILGQPNPVHIPTSHLLEIHPIIFHPSTPRSLSLRFPHQEPIHRPLLTHTRHMSNPSHSSRFYHPQNIWCVVVCLFSCFVRCFLFWVFCVLVLFCVLFLLLYTAVSFPLLYKFTDHCELVETQLHSVIII